MKTEKQKLALLKINREKRLSTESWINKAERVHGSKYDYSATMYTTARAKLKIICPKHGEQEMLPHVHIRGYGCGKCGKEQINISNGNQLSQEEFLNRVNNIEGLSFEKTVYKTKRQNVIVTCKIHGDYETKAEMLLKGHGCRKCSSVNSKGELFIRNYLNCNKITFLEQVKFSDCISSSNRKLSFDFYIPFLNTCIEYDGKQHFQEVKYWGGKEGLEKRQLNDKIKTEFCKDKNINLLRITYLCDIEKVLKEKL